MKTFPWVGPLMLSPLILLLMYFSSRCPESHIGSKVDCRQINVKLLSGGTVVALWPPRAVCGACCLDHISPVNMLTTTHPLQPAQTASVVSLSTSAFKNPSYETCHPHNSRSTSFHSLSLTFGHIYFFVFY